jgi:hypothetical protein
MTIKNNMKSDWTIGFRIPAGATITMDKRKHVALAKRCMAFLKARENGQLTITGNP